MTMRIHAAFVSFVSVLGFVAIARAQNGPFMELEAGNAEDAKRKCVKHFFGPSATPGVGGDGVIMVGALRQSGAWKFVVAPTFSLSLGGSVRLTKLDDRCDAQPTPGNSSWIVRVNGDATWSTSISGAFGVAGLSLIEVASTTSLQGSFSGLALAGFRFQRMWWDDSASSRSTLTIPIGIMGAIGGTSQTAANGSSETVAVGLVGGYVGFRVDF